MNTCNIRKEELVGYCYGELNPQKTEEIKQHLASCKQCEASVQALGKMLSFVKQQKLKKVPPEILENYTQEIIERMTLTEQERSPVFALKERLLAWLDKLRLGFYQRPVPVLAVACIAIFVFVLARYHIGRGINAINQDIALMDELGEDANEVYLAIDKTQLTQELENSDRIMLAQLDSEVETEEAIDDIEILQELEEESIDEEDIVDYLEMLDEIETA